MSEPPTKRACLKEETGMESVLVQLVSVGGEVLGPPLEVPLGTTSNELEKLVASFKEKTEDNSHRVPYAFYARGRDEYIRENLREYLNNEYSREEALHLVFEPLSVFRVRRVGRCSETMPGHSEAVLHVRYSPDGKILASGGGDATVRFWDTATNTPKRTCSGHKHHVLCVAWAPDAKLFASGDRSGEVRVWLPESGRCQAILKRHTKWITALAWKPLHLEDTDESKSLISASKDGSLKLWNAKTGNLLASLTSHTDGIEAIALTGDNRLYSASRDRSIKLWTYNASRKDYTLSRTLAGHSHRINTLALSSAHLIRVGAFDPRAKLSTEISIRDSARDRYLAYVQACGGPAFAERLVSGSDDSTLLFWRDNLALTQSSKQQPYTRLTGHQQPVNAIAFSPDGRKFASASFDKKIKLWHGYTAAFIATLAGHVGACYALAWSPDSRLLVSASKDSTLKLWFAADDEAPPESKVIAKGTRKFAAAIHTLPGHYDEVFCVDWAPNTAQVASGSKDRTIKVWAP